MSLRVLLIADDPLVRGGLAALLSDCSDCLIVGQLASDADIVAAVECRRPDIVLWDTGWDAVDVSRLESLSELRELEVDSVVLVQDARSGVEVWPLGARGLLLRQVKAERLLAALHAVAQGLMVWDDAVNMPVVASAADDTPAGATLFTPREQEVLALLAEGLPNKIVADRLQISEHTVKFHVNAIMGKLGAQSRTEAVVLATRRGLILL